MRALARQAIRSVQVQNLANALGSAPRVDDFMRQRWVIVPDPLDAELIRTPELQVRLLSETGYLAGDCDDAATLAASLLFILDWPCVLRAIRMPGDPEYSHVFLSYRLDGGWFDIDPIVPARSLPVRGYSEVMELEI